jgi:hypothetical protein
MEKIAWKGTSFQRIVTVNKLWKMKWDAQVAHMGESA